MIPLRSFYFGRHHFFFFLSTCPSELVHSFPNPAIPSSYMGPSSSAKDSQPMYGAKGNSSTQSTWSWTWKLLLALIPIFFALYATTRPSKSLPASYALCSNHVGRIYTVDANNTQIECIVVDGPYIVNTGSLGESRHICLVVERSCSITFLHRDCPG